MTTQATSANRLGLDYRAEARRLGPPPVPITDVHTHINGTRTAQLYGEVAALFGIDQICSMTHLESIDAVREIFGERIRWIAVPRYDADDKLHAFTKGWLERIERYAELGCRICKFWTAPRSRDYANEVGQPDLFDFDGPWRQRAMRLARDAGMMFMTHIADPDTWFQTKYADSTVYGTKLDQYAPFEAKLEEFREVPWLCAHMGGYPEELEFLDELLSRHDNLYLDTSATKWMVRELSKHSRSDLLSFLTKWDGRIFFGSDIVTLDEHLKPPTEDAIGFLNLASNKQEAFDLYASRYFALRSLWETDYDDESPIADPDLHMVDPDAFDENDAPRLRGKSLPANILRSLYRDAAANVIDTWHANHT